LACAIVPTAILWQLRTAYLARTADREARRQVASAPAGQPKTRPVAPPLSGNVRPGPSPPSVPIVLYEPPPQVRPAIVAGPSAAEPAPPPDRAALLPSASSPSASSPASSPPAEPPPAKPEDILATLGEAWQLPALISTASEALGSLAGPPQEPLKLSLRSQAANIPAEAAIYADSAGEPGAWSILYVANVQSASGQVPLATIRLDGSQFHFTWSSASENADLRRQVANCQLQVRHGESTRHV
jgi:hypothetical protein